MKISFLIASLVSSGLGEDDSPPSCPNDGWVYDSDVSKCVPADGQVTIQCNADNMVVTLRHKQIYVLMDDTHLNTATSAAMPGTCTTTKSISEDGVYTVTIPLDSCGTDVTQADDKITFNNTISGEDAALEIDGIIVTDPLNLEVACEYPDSFDLTFGDIAVEAGVHTMDSVSMQGSFTNEFSLKSYVNEGRSTQASATSGITIGNVVYNRVEVNGTLPSNVEYVVTDCKAHPIVEDEVNHDIGYDIIKDGCMDILLNAESDELKGNNTNDVDFDFNGFTFSSSMSTLYLECTIILCALNTDGSFKDSECGYQYGGDDCAAFNEDKTLNYEKAPAL